ncbi:MAG: hypothetical protein VKK03_01660 [Synechococcus sp.]|nr:hypothetical protein [Synechococcus sp.]
MRSSYDVKLDSPAGVKSLVVRASSRSKACRMTAEAHPGCSFVVIGRVGAVPDFPWLGQSGLDRGRRATSQRSAGD